MHFVLFVFVSVFASPYVCPLIHLSVYVSVSHMIISCPLKWSILLCTTLDIMSQYTRDDWNTSQVHYRMMDRIFAEQTCSFSSTFFLLIFCFCMFCSVLYVFCLVLSLWISLLCFISSLLSSPPSIEITDRSISGLLASHQHFCHLAIPSNVLPTVIDIIVSLPLSSALWFSCNRHQHHGHLVVTTNLSSFRCHR